MVLLAVDQLRWCAKRGRSLGRLLIPVPVEKRVPMHADSQGWRGITR